MLKPGGEQTVHIRLDLEAFQYWDEARNAWAIHDKRCPSAGWINAKASALYWNSSGANVARFRFQTV